MNPRSDTYDSLVRISRVGTRGADGTLMSDAQQRASNEQAIRALGGRVGYVFEALNESGSTVFDSPKWIEALERVRRGESAGVAVAYHDRLGRNTPEAYAYAAQLHLAGGVLIVNGRVLDQDDPQDRAMFGMAMVQAELTYDLARQRSLRTRAAVRERGIAVRVPYGYRRNRGVDGQLVEAEADPKALVPDPATAPIVERIYRERAAGSSWRAISEALEADGISSPGGGQVWTSSSLATLVGNRSYLGEVTVGDHVTSGAHQALVDAELFEAARPGRKAPRTGKRVHGVAGGLLVCQSCGERLSVQARGDGSTFYACRRVTSGGRCEQPVTGTQAPIDQAIDEALRQLADGEHTVDAVRVHRELEQARVALREAVQELEDLEAAQAALEAAQAVAQGVASFPTSGASWDALDVDAKRQLAAGVIESISLAPFAGRSRKTSRPADRLTIAWR
jgi:DNA invertase Pin-like site-specific DNA recombinase